MEEWVLEVKKVGKQFKEGRSIEDMSFRATNGKIIGFG